MGRRVIGQWVKWVSFLDGSWVDARSPMTHLHIYRKHVVKATFVVGDNWAFNARHIITSQRNLGPDLQNISRQSYDYLTIMPKLRSTYDKRLIYEISFDCRKSLS